MSKPTIKEMAVSILFQSDEDILGYLEELCKQGELKKGIEHERD